MGRPQIPAGELELLVKLVKECLPSADLNLDMPIDPKGTVWIDVKWSGKLTTISWTPGHGFGFYAPDDVGFGEKPKMYLGSAKSAVYYLVRVASQDSRPKVRWALLARLRSKSRLNPVKKSEDRHRSTKHIKQSSLRQYSLKRHDRGEKTA